MICKIRGFEDETYSHRYMTDVKRIKQVLKVNGYNSTLRDCGNLWDDHSDDFAAGWLNLPHTDGELWVELEGLIRQL